MNPRTEACSQDLTGFQLATSVPVLDQRKYSLSRYETPSISSYVDAFLTDEFDERVTKFLEKLYVCQRRLFKSFPTKLAAQRRYVLGWKQARKCLYADECKILFIAPDIDERLASSISDLKKECALRNVPYAFALSKREYSRILHLSGSFSSVVSIKSDEGARDLFLNVLRVMNH